MILLVGVVTVLSGCNQKTDSNNVLDSTEVKSKVFIGVSDQEACELTISWNDSKISDVTLKNAEIQKYLLPDSAGESLSFSDNLKAIQQFIADSSDAIQMQEQGYSPYYVVDQESHFFTQGESLKGQVGWYGGESLEYPAFRQKIILDQSIKLYGEIDLASDVVELTSITFEQSVKGDLPIASGSLTCEGLKATEQQ